MSSDLDNHVSEGSCCESRWQGFGSILNVEGVMWDKGGKEGYKIN